MDEVRLPVETRVGRVSLVVRDLAAAIEFYRDTLGLTLIGRNAKAATLGTPDGTVLLELTEQAGVRKLRPRSRLGLYHFAVLLPGRGDLARFARHLLETHAQFGASDHLVSEAFYLVDPDGIEVEVYADRPRESWLYGANGQLRLTVDALNFAELLAVDDGAWEGVPNGTTVGHMHFYVGDLKTAERLYTEGMGMEVMAALAGSALFVSAGGYHHHVGLNAWAAASPAASESDARMAAWDLVLPDVEAAIAVSGRMVDAGFRVTEGGLEDPWGIRVRVVTER